MPLHARKKGQQLAGPITVSELNLAITTIVKLSQIKSFTREYNSHKYGKSVKTKKLIASLYIFLNYENILRVGGRISNSPDSTSREKYLLV